MFSGEYNQAFEELKDSYARIMREQAGQMDPKELAERESAAGAYATENERHFVDYLEDCVKSSTTANKEIRQVQADCWRVFKEKEPVSYQFKEDWQSRVTIPKPYASVMYGASAVKKAFSPDFLTIENESNPAAESFWQSVLDHQLGNRKAKFVLRFTDATIMALAVGQSMEVIPRYISGAGLHLELVEPWKIFRDPDAPPRDSQGGLFWVHQEWLDYHVLKQGEINGKYHDVARVKTVGEAEPDNPFMTKAAIARRKDQIWERSRFRKMILTSELYGTVLSPSGEVLLDNGTYSVAGGRMIEAPKKVPYQRLRWPGISFSAMPDILTNGGRGLLEGNIRLWEAMCNLMCLHEDGLKFLVNPPTEITAECLVDPTDVDDWPGKKYLTFDTMSGHQVVRSVDRRDVTSSVLANSQYHDQLFQRGSFITDAVQGLPGYRAEVTARESAQNLDQAMGVFGLMGGNLEDGAISITDAVVDVLQTFASPEELLSGVKNPQEVLELMTKSGLIDGNVVNMPTLTGGFSISGMQELLQQADTLRYLTGTVFPLAANPVFAPFIRPYRALKAFELRTNLKDEKLFVDEQTGTVIEAAMKQAQFPPTPPDTPPQGGTA